MKRLAMLIFAFSSLATINLLGESVLKFGDSIFKFRPHNKNQSIPYSSAPFRTSCNEKWELNKKYYGSHVWSLKKIAECPFNIICEEPVIGTRYCQNKIGWYTAKIINGQKGFESYDKKEWIPLEQTQINEENARQRFEPWIDEWIEKEQIRLEKHREHCI